MTGAAPSNNVFLNTSTQAFVNELLEEQKHSEAFKSHNLSVRQKVLLHGPTGNGKTTIAKHIAERLELPLVEINASMVVNASIGVSSQNINRVFVSNRNCVLLKTTGWLIHFW